MRCPEGLGFQFLTCGYSLFLHGSETSILPHQKKTGEILQLPALDNQVDQVSGMVNIQDAMDAESMQLLGPVEFAGRNSMLGFRPTGFARDGEFGSLSKNAGAILGTCICDICIYIIYIYTCL